MRTPAIIRAELVSVEEQLAPLATRRAALEEELLWAKSPFQLGDHITWGTRKLVGCVAGIGRWVGDDPMWRVHIIRKDGSKGLVVSVCPYNNPKRVD